MANAISRAFKETQSEVIVRLISRCNAWVQMELTPIQEIASDRHHCFVSLAALLFQVLITTGHTTLCSFTFNLSLLYL